MVKKFLKLVSAGVLLGASQMIPICASGDSATAIIPIEIEGANDVTVSVTSDSQEALEAVKETTIKCDGSAKTEAVVTADEPVEYEYTLTENAGTTENVKYDESEYKAKVFFEAKDDGDLNSYVVVWKVGDELKSQSVKYYNTSDAVEKSNSGIEGTNVIPSICSFVIGSILIAYANKKRNNRMK